VKEMVQRVNSLEEDSKQWLQSFSNLLHVHPLSIEMDKENPQLIRVTFKNPQEAKLFKQFLPRAGSLIPFVPAQLELNQDNTHALDTTVTVARQINVHLDPVETLFRFTTKTTEDGAISPLYQETVYDRLIQLALAF